MMEYNSYRGRKTGARKWLIALLALVIAGVLAFTALELVIYRGHGAKPPGRTASGR